MTNAVFSCEGLTKAFGAETVVDRLSFRIGPGEAYGLLGPNGAGKSTTIRMICGLLEPDEGAVRGTLFEPTEEPGPAIGYVPQEIALFPTLTLDQNLAYWTRVFGIARRERAERVDAALEAVALLGHRDHRVDQTSGGMQRRVNLAVALLHRPRLLVLDEPTAGVDAQSRASVVATIGGLRDEGTAVLYTSHHLDEASGCVTGWASSTEVRS